MISGHRRKHACEIAGIPTLRCKVLDMSKDEASIFMVDSNMKRTNILPSEKAFACRLRLEAMNRQSMRTDLTSVPVSQMHSINQLAKEKKLAVDKYKGMYVLLI